MKNSAPSAGPSRLRMPPMITIASSSPENVTAIGSADAKRWWNTDSTPAKPHSVGRERERDLLVALGRIADELRALLVLADRDQHRSDRRAMEALQCADDADADAARRARSTPTRSRGRRRASSRA